MTGKVGFVGVGAMGGPMALNLVKAGFEVIVHDINPDRVAPLAAARARVVDTPAAAAAECRRTICMVETADQAEAVILGRLSSAKVLGIIGNLLYQFGQPIERHAGAQHD